MSCRNSETLVMQLLIGLAVCLSMTCILSEAYVLPVDYVHKMQGEHVAMYNNYSNSANNQDFDLRVQPHNQCTKIQILHTSIIKCHGCINFYLILIFIASYVAIQA